MAGAFALDLSKFVAKAKGNSRLVIKKVVLDVDTSVVLKTPVGDADYWEMPAPPGYVGGRARGSWQYAQGAPLEVEPGTIDGSGGAALGRVTAGLVGEVACEHFLTSNVPYMRRLEYEGWSNQAPEGMVRKTLGEYQTFINNAVGDLP